MDKTCFDRIINLLLPQIGDANARQALSAYCHSRQLLDLIADKWTTLILYMLSLKTQRYSELQHGLDPAARRDQGLGRSPYG